MCHQKKKPDFEQLVEHGRDGDSHFSCPRRFIRGERIHFGGV